MEFSQVAGAQEMNRALGLYQIGDWWNVCANSLCGFPLLCCAYVYNGEDNTYMWCEDGLNPAEKQGKLPIQCWITIALD